MAERSSAPSKTSAALTLDDLDRVLKTAGPAERDFLHQLTKLDNPREAMTFSRILHHFSGARFDDSR